MITAGRIRERLEQKPFRPFRICLSDGTVHEVPHPELAWPVGNRIFVAVPSHEEDWSVKQLSVLHITRTEEFNGHRRKK